MSPLSFHYLSMAVHSMIQKNFMEQVKSSGLTSGQPKVLDYLRDHNGANQKEIAAACHIEPGSLVEDNFASIEKKAFRNISSEEQAAFMETFSKIYENLMNKGDTTHE